MTIELTQRAVDAFGFIDQTTPPLAFSLDGAAAWTALSKNALRAHIDRGFLEVRYVSSKPVVRAAALLAWVGSLPVLSPVNPLRSEGHQAAVARPTDIATSPLAYSIAGAAAAVGVRETLLREHIMNHRLIAGYPNTKPIVSAVNLADWLDHLPTVAPGSPRLR